MLLFYLENTFNITITDCDFNLDLVFTKHLISIGDKISRRTLRYDVSYMAWLQGVSWTNLMEGCRKVREGTLGSYPLDADDDGDVMVICAANQIVVNSRGSWESCQWQLEALRVVAGVVNPKWLQ